MDTEEFIEFIKTEKPVYSNNKLVIELIDHLYFGQYLNIRVKHHGWKCPSMYHDAPEENGHGEVIRQYINQNGLFLKFTTDDYSEQTYLVVKVINKNTLSIIYDAYKIAESDTLLHRNAITKISLSQ